MVPAGGPGQAGNATGTAARGTCQRHGWVTDALLGATRGRLPRPVPPTQEHPGGAASRGGRAGAARRQRRPNATVRDGGQAVTVYRASASVSLTPSPGTLSGCCPPRGPGRCRRAARVPPPRPAAAPAVPARSALAAPSPSRRAPGYGSGPCLPVRYGAAQPGPPRPRRHRPYHGCGAGRRPVAAAAERHGRAPPPGLAEIAAAGAGAARGGAGGGRGGGGRSAPPAPRLGTGTRNCTPSTGITHGTGQRYKAAAPGTELQHQHRDRVWGTSSRALAQSTGYWEQDICTGDRASALGTRCRAPVPSGGLRHISHWVLGALGTS